MIDVERIKNEILSTLKGPPQFDVYHTDKGESRWMKEYISFKFMTKYKGIVPLYDKSDGHELTSEQCLNNCCWIDLLRSYGLEEEYDEYNTLAELYNQCNRVEYVKK